jgi:hypothetical protein
MAGEAEEEAHMDEAHVEQVPVTPTFCKNKNFVQIGVYIKL